MQLHDCCLLNVLLQAGVGCVDRDVWGLTAAAVLLHFRKPIVLALSLNVHHNTPTPRRLICNVAFQHYTVCNILMADRSLCAACRLNCSNPWSQAMYRCVHFDRHKRCCWTQHGQMRRLPLSSGRPSWARMLQLPLEGLASRWQLCRTSPHLLAPTLTLAVLCTMVQWLAGSSSFALAPCHVCLNTA